MIINDYKWLYMIIYAYIWLSIWLYIYIYISFYIYIYIIYIYIHIHISDISQQPNVDWWQLVAFREAQGEAGLDDLAWRRTQLQQLELATCILRSFVAGVMIFHVCFMNSCSTYFTYLYLLLNLLMLLQWVQTSNSGPFSLVNPKQYETIKHKLGMYIIYKQPPVN